MVLRTFEISPQICLNVHFWMQNFLHYFFRFVGPESFRTSPILYGFWRLLTIYLKYAQTSIFGRKIFFINFFVFRGSRAFEWAPYCVGLDEFWHLTRNMPKRPLLDANFFPLFFSFSWAQELSNEPHIVWFRRILTFNPKYAQTSTFGPNFIKIFFSKNLGKNKNFELLGVSLRRLYRFET